MLAEKKEASRELVDLWVALQLEAASKLVGDTPEAMVTARKLAAFDLASLLNSTTLAMLYDDEVTFAMGEKGMTLDARICATATRPCGAVDGQVGSREAGMTLPMRFRRSPI